MAGALLYSLQYQGPRWCRVRVKDAEFCDFSGVTVSFTKGSLALVAKGTVFRPEMTSMAYATLSTAGYAGRPQAEKLGYFPGAIAAFVGLPEDLADLPGSVDFGKVARRQDWSRPMGNMPFDIIHAFTLSRAELTAGLPRLRRAIQPDGMIWVSWPKQASRVPTDVTEDIIRAEALKHDLVDVKVAAIDHVWSGLKLVIRVDRR